MPGQNAGKIATVRYEIERQRYAGAICRGYPARDLIFDGEFIGCRKILSRKMPGYFAGEIATVRDRVKRHRYAEATCRGNPARDNLYPTVNLNVASSMNPIDNRDEVRAADFKEGV
jgi:hypothetical protein